MTRRASDNQTAPLWIEAGETRTTLLVSVAPVAPIDKIYTYTVDDEMASRLSVGRRVLVPFGRKDRPAPAFVVGIETGPWSSTLKPVAEILEPAGQLSDHLLELGKWIARYYCCPLGRTLAAMVPQAVRKQSGFVTVRHATLVATSEDLSSTRLGAKQRQLIEYLQQANEQVDVGTLLEKTGASRSTLRSLIAKGWVAETVTKEVPQPPVEENVRDEPDFNLNPDQRTALAQVTDALDVAEFRALVLYGVSGSGKTEVYVHAIRHVLATRKQAIMLVPEIALTTQLMQRLMARFDRVAVIHSGLTGVQRSLAWERIRTGYTPVVIGTRSAVFAPCPDLGLIVVDEEQEPSYKNLQSPRFNVRDVAIKRAALLGIPVLLGSATPSLETWHNLERLSTYTRLDLPYRVRALPMPRVRLVNMREELGVSGGSSLSQSLHNELTITLDRKEQAILLVNRRGYATWLYCPGCKRRVQCLNCNTSMVLHLSRKQMLCHHCHDSMDVPIHCADMSCQTKLIHGGGGTERVEKTVRAAFPNARIHRADSDTMTHVRKYQELVSAFETGDLDVLIGTQMIAKGLDFPNVSLVGVIGADVSSSLSDFRAGERLFQLVTQVAGRAGRADVPGRVVVQSKSIDLPELRFAVHHDFEGFASVELAKRRAMGLPPFCRMTRFILAGKRDREVAEQANDLGDRIRETIEKCGITGAVVFGAHPCAIERLRGLYRHEILLHVPTAGQMLTILDTARHSGALKVRVKSFVIDVDPVSLA